MTDQTLTLDPRSLETMEECNAVIQQYQQWLADRDLSIAILNVKYATSAGKQQVAEHQAQELQNEVARLQAEVEVLRDAKGVKSAGPIIHQGRSDEAEDLDPV